MSSYAKIQAALADSEENSWGMIDILTLLLVFFIILYINEKGAGPDNFQEQQRPMVQTAAPAQAAAPPTTGVSADPAPPPTVATGHPGSGEGTAQGLLSHYFSDFARDGFMVSGNVGQFTLTLEEKLAFASGRAEPREPSLPILERLAELLAGKPAYRVVIAGHSDDLPISSERYPSNWYLSSARAVAVAEYLQQQGVDPGRLTTQGHAEFKPRVANDSPQNRAKNRRVEITLLRDEPTGP